MSQELKQERPSVRKLLLSSFTISMILLLALVGASLYLQYLKYHDREIASRRDGVLSFYERGMREQAVTLGVLLETLARDNRILNSLESHNAEALHNLYETTFAITRDSYGIDCMFFIDPARTIITRMCSQDALPAEFANDPSFATAERTRHPVAAIEISTVGKLSLSLIKPLFKRDELLGFVKAAMSIEHLVDSVATSQKSSLIFFLHKDAVVQKNWDLGTQRKDSKAGWIDLDENTYVYSVFPSVEPEFLRKLYAIRKAHVTEESYNTLYDNGSSYVVTALPVTNSFGEDLGDLFILEDATELRNDSLFTAIAILLFGVVVVFISYLLASKKLRATDTEIAAMVAKMKESDVVFQNVFEESDTGFILQNWITGEIISANKSALHIFAAENAESIDLAAMRPLPENDDLQGIWQASGSQSPLMVVKTERDTSYCEMSPFFLGFKEDVQCIALRDVTQVVNLQYENRKQIEYLQAIIDQIPGIIFIKDTELRLTLYNAMFEDFFSNGADMIGSVRYGDWLDEAFMDKILRIDREVLTSGVSHVYESTVTSRKGEEHTFFISKQILYDKDGAPFLLGVGTDISERSIMEKQLIKLREKAEEASLAKSQFLARMSHEIRTPMNAIIGMSHLAINANPDAKQLNYLSKIHGAAKNLLGIINDILDFSKIEAGEMSLEQIPFNLKDVLSDLKTISAPLLTEKPVIFRVEVPELATDFIGDPLRMRQILINLVNNAIKFTAEGEVVLSCVIKDEDTDYAVMEFAVRDTGIGISEDGLKRLFSSFQQVDGSTTRKYGGTGLGLVISRQFVNLMGGDITVSSAEGKGTTFSFILAFEKTERQQEELPLPENTAVWEQHDSDTAQVLQQSAANEQFSGFLPVLVVEDNEINQEIIVELLEGFGVSVEAVNNGKEAVDAVAAGGKYSIVLMDLQMPVMDGLEATTHIRALPDQQGTALPIVALTANAMLEDRDRCLEIGMNDFLSKPIDVDELKEKLKRWLGRTAPQ